MLEELNELEKIGLAFVSGLIAGQSLEKADQEVEAEEDAEETPKKVMVGKIEGEKAEKIYKIDERIGVE